MLKVVFDMFAQCFLTVFNSLSRLELSEGISAWDWIVGCFIGFGVLSALIHSIGFEAMSDSATSTANTYKKSKEKKSSKGD